MESKAVDGFRTCVNVEYFCLIWNPVEGSSRGTVSPPNLTSVCLLRLNSGLIEAED